MKWIISPPNEDFYEKNEKKNSLWLDLIDSWVLLQTRKWVRGWMGLSTCDKTSCHEVTRVEKVWVANLPSLRDADFTRTWVSARSLLSWLAMEALHSILVGRSRLCLDRKQ